MKFVSCIVLSVYFVFSCWVLSFVSLMYVLIAEFVFSVVSCVFVDRFMYFKSPSSWWQSGFSKANHHTFRSCPALMPFWQEVHKVLQKVFQVDISFKLEILYLGALPSEIVISYVGHVVLNSKHSWQDSHFQKEAKTRNAYNWWLDWHNL